MNQIEVAKRIIENNGVCGSYKHIAGCDYCPISDRCGPLTHRGKVNYLINWLTENDKENVMSDKIQMTEKQAREILHVAGLHIVGERLKSLKKAGYIKKSELQQKVEEVEEIVKNGFIELQFKNSIEIKYNVLCGIKEAIQLLKKDHPEFKEDK